MQSGSERHFVDAAARAVNHDADVAGVHVRDRRRQQEQRDDEYDDHDQHATDLATNLAATVPGAEVHRRQAIADRATH